MKKSKVDKLIKQSYTNGVLRGRIEGSEKERSKWERLLPASHESHITWLDNRPPDKLRTVVVLPNSYVVQPVYSNAHIPFRNDMRIDFEPIPMALSLATGQQIRWFHWKPIGPYPVTELAVLR